MHQASLGALTTCITSGPPKLAASALPRFLPSGGFFCSVIFSSVLSVFSFLTLLILDKRKHQSYFLPPHTLSRPIHHL